MNTSPPISKPQANAAETARRGKQLFKLGLLLFVAVAVYYAFNANVRSQTHLLLGLFIVFLAFLPALLWARRGKPSLPVFEALLFTCFNTYALPLLNGHEDLIRYTESDITSAALAVIAFQSAAISAYHLVSVRPSTARFWTNDIISAGITKWLGYGIGINTLYIVISTFTTLIPPSVGSILRAVFFGFGIICMFVTSRRLGQDVLGSGERVWFFVNIVIQCVCMMATLFLVSTVTLLLLTLVGYISSSGRIPLIAASAGLALLAILHNGKAAMREKYWEPVRTTPPVSKLPAFYGEWFGHGLKRGGDSDDNKRMTGKLIDRTSLIQILCLVVSSSPSQLPYLYGETYADIPAQLVPRIFWPNKPLGHVSTSRLSVYYGLQNEEDTLKTTIGFGLQSEAYANFGYFGLFALGVFIGFVFKKIQASASGRPLFSYGGLLTIILLAWSFQVEFTLSIWIASFYQAALVVLGIPYIVRNFFQSAS